MARLEDLKKSLTKLSSEEQRSIHNVVQMRREMPIKHKVTRSSTVSPDTALKRMAEKNPSKYLELLKKELEGYEEKTDS